jgi:hypothetical protein
MGPVPPAAPVTPRETAGTATARDMPVKTDIYKFGTQANRNSSVSPFFVIWYPTGT